MGYEPNGFFFGNFSLPSKKNCPAQYEDKLVISSLFLILRRTVLS